MNPEAMSKRSAVPADRAHRDGERYGLRRTLGTERWEQDV